MNQSPNQIEKKSSSSKEKKRIGLNKTSNLIAIAALVILVGVGFLYLRSDSLPQNQESITAAITLDLGDDVTSDETSLEIPPDETLITEEQKEEII